MNRFSTFFFLAIAIAYFLPEMNAADASKTEKQVVQATTLFLTMPPETLLATKPNRRKFIEPVKRKSGKYPNWANLRNETVVQGGFQPGASQSDSAGSMRIGVSFMYAKRPGHINPKWKPVKDSAKVYCWVRLTEWKWRKSKGVGAELIPKTLRSQGTIFHDGPARGLDSTGVPGDSVRQPLRRERRKLEPIRSSNKMFPEIVALKLNIAMSELGKTPAGFGDLIFDVDGNFLDEKSIVEIAAVVDTMMTRWTHYSQDQFDSAWSALSAINRAFAGPLDTLTWFATDSLHPNGNLTVSGQVDIATVSFLRLPVDFAPTIMASTSGEVEDEPVFGDEEITEDDDEVDGVPVAATVFQNYPNPFNPTTTIAFQLSDESRVTVRVMNILGQEVASVLNGEEMDGGSQSVMFDASNLASGVYFYQVIAQNLDGSSKTTSFTGKMMLMK